MVDKLEICANIESGFPMIFAQILSSSWYLIILEVFQQHWAHLDIWLRWILFDIWYWRYVFQIGILLNIVEKMTGIDSSCSDIHRTPKEWTSWLGINYNSFNLAWNGKTIKIELHEPNVFRDGGNFLPPFSFSGVCSKFANMVIMMMMIIN